VVKVGGASPPQKAQQEVEAGDGTEKIDSEDVPPGNAEAKHMCSGERRQRPGPSAAACARAYASVGGAAYCSAVSDKSNISANAERHAPPV